MKIFFDLCTTTTKLSKKGLNSSNKLKNHFVFNSFWEKLPSNNIKRSHLVLCACVWFVIFTFRRNDVSISHVFIKIGWKCKCSIFTRNMRALEMKSTKIKNEKYYEIEKNYFNVVHYVVWYSVYGMHIALYRKIDRRPKSINFECSLHEHVIDRWAKKSLREKEQNNNNTICEVMKLRTWKSIGNGAHWMEVDRKN